MAVGVDASLFDATVVLIAVVTLGQLPVGPITAKPTIGSHHGRPSGATSVKPARLQAGGWSELLRGGSDAAAAQHARPGGGAGSPASIAPR